VARNESDANHRNETNSFKSNVQELPKSFVTKPNFVAKDSNSEYHVMTKPSSNEKLHLLMKKGCCFEYLQLTKK
jgi:hypothetical protein